MTTPPILLLAYNRPEKFSDLLCSLRESRPKLVYVSFDGPKEDETDAAKVAHTRESLTLIDWPCDLRILKHDSNIGIRKSVTHAVSRVLNENDSVVVIEDDVRVGPNFLRFCSFHLDKYRNEKKIGQINGWNQVPYSVTTDRTIDCRLSVYNTSYAWATWSDRWAYYDDTLSWGLAADLRQIKEITGSMRSAMQWRLNFKNANDLLVDSWSYRWLASLWSRSSYCITPSKSQITYTGFDDGTHTRSRRRVSQNPVDEDEAKASNFNCKNPRMDQLAERWLRESYFNDSLYGVTKTILARKILQTLS